MQSLNDRILVLGAGELGLAVLEALASHSQRSNDSSITVLLRRGRSAEMHAQWLKSKGIEILEADVVSASGAELTELFAAGKYSTIIGCTGMTYPPGTQLKLVQAVLRAQTPRYFPWQFGVDYDAIGEGSGQDLFDEQIQVRNLLRAQQKTGWCIVSTGMFMSFLFEPVFGVVTNESQGRWKVRGLGGWANRVTVTDVKDIARVIAELVQKVDQQSGIVYTAGETVSYDQLATKMAKVIGNDELEREDWSLDTLRKELGANPTDGMRKYRIVFGSGKGVSWDVESTVNHQWSMKTLQVEEWIETHLRKQ